MDFTIPTEARLSLLRAARSSLEQAFRGEEPDRSGPDPLPGAEPGAFVTLTEGGRLRGCIGRMTGSEPILDTIVAMARAAAFEDPRFRPLAREELPQIQIEITVLSPLRPIASIEEIEVGRHGLYITKGWHSGVLLPQVAVEYGWDRLVFLEQLCRKAGLPEDAWKSPEAKILVFEGIVFNEAEYRQARGPQQTN